MDAAAQDERPWVGVCELCSCCGTFDFMVRALNVNLAVMTASLGLLLQSLTIFEDALGLSATQIGVVLALEDVPVLLFGTHVAHVLKNNKPFWIGAGQLLLSVCNALFGSATTFAQLLVASFVSGVAKLPVWNLTWAHVDDNVTDKSLVPAIYARLLAALFLGGGAGFVVSGVVLGDCTDENDDDSDCATRLPTHGVRQGATVTLTVLPQVEAECGRWRVLFFVAALAVIPSALWLMQSKQRYPDNLKECTTVATDEFTSPRLIREVPVTFWAAVRAIVQNMRMVVLLARTAVANFFGLSVLPFVPWFMERKLCMSKFEVSMVIVPVFVMVMVGFVTGGLLVGRFGLGVRRQFLLLLCIEVLLAPVSLAFLTTNKVVFGLCLCFFACLTSVTTPCVLNLHQRLVLPEHKTYSSALFNLVSRAASVPAPILFGYMLDREGEDGFLEAKWVFTLWSGVSSVLLFSCAGALLHLHTSGNFPDLDRKHSQVRRVSRQSLAKVVPMLATEVVPTAGTIQASVVLEGEPDVT
eukprot:TRINITY_DN24044_c0_g1_i1.p1 TRINITY_DN24044_c0_g1~~TRINITY_DN24044_c0_g1_i1.p1  ORF type:complete len:526 (+),score=126.07 TRINITY_DN24044_c0_g1_i1:55-1632(+)